MLRVGTQPMREAISMQSVMEYPYAPSGHAADALRDTHRSSEAHIGRQRPSAAHRGAQRSGTQR